MLIGILSDTHDEIRRTELAVDVLRSAGAELLVHCGDIVKPDVVRSCSILPLHFVFGNHDSDMVRELEAIALETGANCLGWGGEIVAAGKRIGVVHGHLTTDLQPILDECPDYLLSGHSHATHDFQAGKTRRINPGALHRAEDYTVATLDVASDKLQFHSIRPA